MNVKNTYLSMGRRIRMIRELSGLNQESFASIIGVKRPSLSQMEGDKILPSLRTLSKLVGHFHINYMWLLEGEGDMYLGGDSTGAGLGNETRDASSVVPSSDDEKSIAFVPLTVQAGYIRRSSKDAFLAGVERFSLPGFSSKKSRAFQVHGDSMLPAISHEDWLICEHIDTPDQIAEGAIYVLITSDDLLCKRIEDRLWDKGCLILKSDNVNYADQRIQPEELKEIWCVRAKISSDFDSAARALRAERATHASTSQALANMNEAMSRLMAWVEEQGLTPKKKRREGDSNPR